LPFEDSSFDAILCVDAISHLPNRVAAVSEWRRLLSKGGRLIFTDPFVVTGPIAKGEIDGRSALGSNLVFVPPGFNEDTVAASGLMMVSRVDRAAAVEEIASRWYVARERRAELLKREEGEDWFERRQRMLATSAELAKSRRLSRFLYVAEKPS
jgi:SAM-dependent methyltransferase